jgi:alkanesulfonate monooxygenase SsuD/methylene tetrahydromethanopterin reductase-like flavin-dependent oxidoreductase (luciferase family)
MKIGLQIPNFTWAPGPARIGGTLEDIARTAEAAGFCSLWVMDHFFQIPPVGPAETDMLEGYSTLSYLAAVTSKVRLGTMATGVVYRHPGILVKTVTTLDVLSGGRAYMGHRRRLVRTRGAGPRYAVPAHRHAVRTAGGGAADRQADVVRR